MLSVAVQTGPVRETPTKVVSRCFEAVSELADKPDLIVLPELFSLPFFCVGLADPHFFDWAETLRGPTITAASENARRLECHVVVPFFEKGDLPGEHYNAAAVIGPDGELIMGTLPDGAQVATYRKNAISSFTWQSASNDEKYYFRPGQGFPVFRTEIGALGILICYDRWFPEAWRVLALQGAEIMCVPTTSTGKGAELFHPSLRTWAAQNVLFAVTANRAGSEPVGEVVTSYFGLSCIVSPRGEVLAKADRRQGFKAIAAPVDLAQVAEARRELTMYRDRRPELYRLIGEK